MRGSASDAAQMEAALQMPDDMVLQGTAKNEHQQNRQHRLPLAALLHGIARIWLSLV